MYLNRYSQSYSQACPPNWQIQGNTHREGCSSVKAVFWEEIPFHTLTENTLLEQRLIKLQRALGAGEGRGIQSPHGLGAEPHRNMLLYDAWTDQTFVLVNNIWELAVYSVVNRHFKSDLLGLSRNRLSIFYANTGKPDQYMWMMRPDLLFSVLLDAVIRPSLKGMRLSLSKYSAKSTKVLSTAGHKRIYCNCVKLFTG